MATIKVLAALSSAVSARFRKSLFIVCAAMFVSSQASLAQADTATNVSAADRLVGLAERVLHALTVEKEGFSVALYPAASYSERQGLSVGIMPLLQINGSRLPHPATLTPTVLVSTKGMFEVQCDADVYFPRRLDVVAKFETYRLPDDFYAIGGRGSKTSIAEYEFMRRMFTVDVTKGVGATNWLCGVSTDADYYRFGDVCPLVSDSALWSRLVSDAGGCYGAGIVVGYDSRTDKLVPTEGAYVRLRMSAYARIFGRGHSFRTLSVDVRRYWSLPLRSVLAAQLYAAHSWGDVPFVKMPSCGGSRLGRAIGHSLKYVDNDAWLLQSEWRVPLFWRIGATCFVACGNASHVVADAFEAPHLMAGGGLRFSVFPGKGLNLRLDAGLSNKGDRAVYFNVREAF